MSVEPRYRKIMQYDSNGVPLGEQAIILDDYTTVNVTYVCKAKIGTLSSVASWQIMKIDESTGMVITWADGNSSYDNIADNRAALSYS